LARETIWEYGSHERGTLWGPLNFSTDLHGVGTSLLERGFLGAEKGVDLGPRGLFPDTRNVLLFRGTKDVSQREPLILFLWKGKFYGAFGSRGIPRGSPFQCFNRAEV